jgi:hypothetical protein
LGFGLRWWMKHAYLRYKRSKCLKMCFYLWITLIIKNYKGSHEMHNAHSYLGTDKMQTYKKYLCWANRVCFDLLPFIEQYIYKIWWSINKRHYYLNRDDLGSRSLVYGSKYESLTLKNHIPIQKQSFRRQLTSFISEFWFYDLM